MSRRKNRSLRQLLQTYVDLLQELPKAAIFFRYDTRHLFPVLLSELPMSAVTRAAVEAVLSQYTDPYLNQDPVSAGCVKHIEIVGDRVNVQLEIGYAAGLFKSGWAQLLQLAIENLDGVVIAKVEVNSVIAAHKAQAQIPGLANVKNVVAVASGKGGVGKSTTAANLALALAREGAKVGILDADIYGPSQGIMFGIPERTRPEVKDQKWFVPLKAHGVEVMSMAFLTDDNTPMVWRGPPGTFSFPGRNTG